MEKVRGSSEAAATQEKKERQTRHEEAHLEEGAKKRTKKPAREKGTKRRKQTGASGKEPKAKRAKKENGTRRDSGTSSLRGERTGDEEHEGDEKRSAVVDAAAKRVRRSRKAKMVRMKDQAKKAVASANKTKTEAEEEEEVRNIRSTPSQECRKYERMMRRAGAMDRQRRRLRMLARASVPKGKFFNPDEDIDERLRTPLSIQRKKNNVTRFKRQDPDVHMNERVEDLVAQLEESGDPSIEEELGVFQSNYAMFVMVKEEGMKMAKEIEDKIEAEEKEKAAQKKKLREERDRMQAEDDANRFGDGFTKAEKEPSIALFFKTKKGPVQVEAEKYYIDLYYDMVAESTETVDLPSFDTSPVYTKHVPSTYVDKTQVRDLFSKCPNCEVEGSFITDTSGYLICKSCAAVLDSDSRSSLTFAESQACTVRKNMPYIRISHVSCFAPTEISKNERDEGRRRHTIEAAGGTLLSSSLSGFGALRTASTYMNCCPEEVLCC